MEKKDRLIEPLSPDDPTIPIEVRKIIWDRSKDFWDLGIVGINLIERGKAESALALFRVLLGFYQNDPLEKNIIIKDIGDCYTVLNQIDAAHVCYETVLSCSDDFVFQHASGREAVIDSLMLLTIDNVLTPEQLRDILDRLEKKIPQLARRIKLPKAQLAILIALTALGEKQRVRDYYNDFQKVLKSYKRELPPLPLDVLKVLGEGATNNTVSNPPSAEGVSKHESTMRHSKSRKANTTTESDFLAPSSLRMEAYAKWENGKIDQALKILDGVLQTIEDYFQQLVELGVLGEKEREEEIRRERMVTLLRIGLYEAEVGKRQESLSHLREALKLHQQVRDTSKSVRNDLVEAYTMLLEDVIETGNEEDVVKLIKEAYKTLPKFLIRLKRRDLVEEILKACIQTGHQDIGLFLYEELAQAGKLKGLQEDILQKLSRPKS